MTCYVCGVNTFLRIQLSNMESCKRSSLYFMILLMHFYYSNAVYSVSIFFFFWVI